MTNVKLWSYYKDLLEMSFVSFYIFGDTKGNFHTLKSTAIMV